MSVIFLREIIKRVLPAKMVYAIQQWSLRRSIANYPSRVVCHQYGMHKLSVRLSDSLAEGWYDRDWNEPDEITLLKKGRLKPGAVVFDLGAHQGVVAMLLAREAGPSGKVIAVEATRHNAEIARENLRLNQIENVNVIHAAVAEKDGCELFFTATLDGAVQHDGAGDRVSTVSIDSLAREHGMPDVVFIDVEGYECQALAGAHEVLGQGADFFVEVHVGAGLEENGTVEQVFGQFPSSRYLLQVSTGEEMPFFSWKEGGALPSHRFFLSATLKS
ncbi:MAG: hypothetical protein B7Z37_06075 [Verrucomicrobia bacterium 12-59-8]|nr:MAG: hypothetical protein B7Z37_06075 [Verrucomicrobia bacterium 12-59-8]